MSSLLFAHVSARVSQCRILSKITLALSLCAASAAVAASEPLTLEQAQQQALARSRQLTAQDHAIAGARAMAVAAGQLPDPILRAGIDNLPVTTSERFSLDKDFMTMRRIGVSQELTRADKRQWRSARYVSEAQKSAAQKEVVHAAILRDTAIAWLERYYMEQLVALVAAQEGQARQEIQAAEAAYRSGRGAQADVLAARSALLLLADRASDVARRLQLAQTVLARWTGVAGDVTLAGTPNIDTINLDTINLDTINLDTINLDTINLDTINLATINLDSAELDAALAHHPRTTVLSRQEDVAQAEVHLARANQRADWSVEVAFQQRGSAYSNMVSVGVSVPLQWDRKKRQDRELSAKLAAVEQTTAERDELLREHIAETRATIIEWRSGRERVSRYMRELIPLSGARTEALTAAYRGGKATLTDVLAARRNETELQMQAIELKRESARLWAQLNFLFPEGGAAQHGATSIIKDIK